MISQGWLYWTVPVVIAGVWIVGSVLHNGEPNLKSAVQAKPVAASTNGEITNAAASDNFAERWEKWQQRLTGSGHEVELAADFEALVLSDPSRALSLARKEKNPTRRDQLMKIILMLWADTDPRAAATEASRLPSDERSSAVAAVLAGASKDATVAVQLAREFCRTDHELALAHGYSLVNTLGKTGQFRAAVSFAAEASAGEESEDANKWLKAAYAQWAALDPVAALAAVNELAGPAHRFEALDSVVTSRVGIDPAGLAEALRRLPSAEDRNLVLGHALRTWVNNDVGTASQWLNQQDPNPDLDAGASAVAKATQEQMLNQRPEVALSWAESIVSPELRSQTLAAVVTKWSASDRAQARRYVETSADLFHSDRADLLVRLQKRTAQ